MKRALSVALLALAGSASAHSEVVVVTTALTVQGAALRADAQLIGRTSGLPIRGAHVELALSRATPADRAARRADGTLDPRPERLRGDALIQRVPLAQDDAGHYVGTLPRVAAGAYVLTIIDTTYRGETTSAARALTFTGAPAKVAVELPATQTPGRYLMYALLGILVPFLIPVIAIVNGNRKQRASRAP